MQNRPRLHHYLPKFYLAGFTVSGEVTDCLYALDQGQIKEWQTTPEHAAKARDFYSIDLGPDQDPLAIERLFASLEANFSRIVYEIVERGALPVTSFDFNWFLNFVAVMAARVPRIRKIGSLVTDKVLRSYLRAAMLRDETAEQMRALFAGRGKVLDDIKFEELKSFILSGSYTVDLDQTTHVQMMVQYVGSLLPALAARQWSLGIVAPDAPDLICSDTPVSVWPKVGADLSKPLTMHSANTLLCFPINRRTIALASFEKHAPVLEVSEHGVAGFNSITITEARQVFAPSDDFTYLDQGKTVKRKSQLMDSLRQRGGKYTQLPQIVDNWLETHPFAETL